MTEEELMNKFYLDIKRLAKVNGSKEVPLNPLIDQYTTDEKISIMKNLVALEAMKPISSNLFVLVDNIP